MSYQQEIVGATLLASPVEQKLRHLPLLPSFADNIIPMANVQMRMNCNVLLSCLSPVTIRKEHLFLIYLYVEFATGGSGYGNC